MATEGSLQFGTLQVPTLLLRSVAGRDIRLGLIALPSLTSQIVNVLAVIALDNGLIADKIQKLLQGRDRGD